MSYPERFLHLSRADKSVRPDVAGRLIELSQVLRRSFSTYVDDNQWLIDEAAGRGDLAIDLTDRVPPAAAPAAKGLDQLFEEADTYCSTGKHLLTLGTPTGPRDYRRWFISQFVDQVAAAAPVSFSDWLESHREEDPTRH